MDWMKANIGKTLADALEEYKRLEEVRNTKGFESKIPPSNQYNRYLREFSKHYPNKSLIEAKRCWSLKKQLPAQHIFHPNDIHLKQ